MDELGLDPAQVASWFTCLQEQPFVLVSISESDVTSWAGELANAVRRCYIADDLLVSKAIQHGLSEREVLASRLPDPGSTMSGDFGEILVYVYQATSAQPKKLIGPKKWRLKQDRTKPAPYSDVIHFLLPEWPAASKYDALFCSEVKTKATASTTNPIASAVADSEKDRTSRLAKTLVWLRERALTDDIGAVSLDQLARFINSTEHPPAQHNFSAVAVVCASLAEAELKNAIPSSATCKVVVVVVPFLKDAYTSVFDGASASSPSGAGV
jgi:hypothetical protein